MTDNVTLFSGVTRLDTDPDRLLKAAAGHLSDVVVLGWSKDGAFHFAASNADGGEVLWLLERARHKLMLTTDRLESEIDEG
jgi:hypothetical protein